MPGRGRVDICARLGNVVRERVWCTKPRISWISLSFIASAIGVFASGLPCTYPLYTEFLKNFFNITHSKVSFVSSVSAFGLSFHLPAAFLYDHVGPRWTLLVAAIVTCSGFTLLFLSLCLPAIQKTSYLLLGLYLYMISNGRTFTYMSSFSAAMWNTPTPHRAKVTALLDMVYEVATLIQMIFYYNIFHGNEMQTDDIVNFLLFSTAFFFVCHATCGPFVVKKPMPEIVFNVEPGSQGKDVSTEESTTVEQSAIFKSATAIRLQRANKQSSLKFLFSCEFLLLNFSMSLPIAISNCIFYNATHFTHSLEVRSLNQAFLIVFKVVVVVVRISMGASLDRFRGNRKIYWINISVFVIAVLGPLALLISLETDGTPQAALLMFVFISAGVVKGAMYTFVPVLLSDVCGMPHFARNVALVYTSGTVLDLIIQISYGYMYEAAVTQVLPNDNETIFESHGQFNYSHDLLTDMTEINCVGSACVRPIAILAAVLTTAASAMFVFLALRLNDKCLFGKLNVDTSKATESQVPQKDIPDETRV